MILQVFRGDESSWTQVVEAARTGSLFAPKRALVVRNADALKGDGEEMVGYLADPDQNLSLILLTVKPDKRKTVWKRLLESASVIPADPLKGRALRARVQERLRQRRMALREDDYMDTWAHKVRPLLAVYYAEESDENDPALD